MPNSRPTRIRSWSINSRTGAETAVWGLTHRTPFAVAAMPQRDQYGREHWCLAVRAGFDVTPRGGLRLSEVQPEVLLAPRTAGASGQTLAADTDIVPFIPGTDIILRGTVRAPEAPRMSVPLLVQIGQIERRAVVFGRRIAERRWWRWAMASSEPVADTGLSWANAWGGASADQPGLVVAGNPVGTGLALSKRAPTVRGQQAELPRICSPEDDFLARADAARPVGFGPVGRSWEPRLGYAGTYDERWEAQRAPLLPEDFDPRFYHCAPPDLCSSVPMVGGEPVCLTGFRPEGPLQFNLPRILLSARTRLGGRFVESAFRIARVDIDIDLPSLSLLWVGAVPCNGREATLESSCVALREMHGVER